MWNRIFEACHSSALIVARISLFVVYFWFGILKIFDVSSANPLIGQLLEKTLPFVTFGQFIIFFGIFEMIIGLIFLFPKLDRLSIVLFAIHMVTTVMPLILLPEVAWLSPFVPTLEGQYMIKNIALIALALTIAASHYREERRDSLPLPG